MEMKPTVAPVTQTVPTAPAILSGEKRKGGGP
jgi:hypothetical protein